jgi:hypothetical protein
MKKGKSIIEGFLFSLLMLSVSAMDSPNATLPAVVALISAFGLSVFGIMEARQ